MIEPMIELTVDGDQSPVSPFVGLQLPQHATVVFKIIHLGVDASDSATSDLVYFCHPDDSDLDAVPERIGTDATVTAPYVAVHQKRSPVVLRCKAGESVKVRIRRTVNDPRYGG